MKKNTFAAISTGMTNSGISIVRMSGPESIEIVDRVFRGKDHRKIAEQKSHTIHYGIIYDGDEAVDEVLVSVMKGPNSYTGDDVVEVNCHGGILVTRKILQLLVQQGARPAEPGEFTKMAFLNGRIDLTRAEAVMDIINAKNDYALSASVRQLRGSVSDKIRMIREKLLYEVAFIESAIDDPEHYDSTGYGETLLPVIKEQLNEIRDLLKTVNNGKILKEGVNTVIVGKPNAGKSSLLNLLVGEEKAIVTDVEGTTRDVLEESVILNGIQLNLIDTAGIRETQEVVERIGVERAIRHLDEADLVLYVVDGSRKLDARDEKIMELLKDKKVLVLLNKSDLPSVASEEELCCRFGSSVLSFSAKEGQGLSALEEAVREMFFQGEIAWNDQVFITSERHAQELREAAHSLELVLRSIEDGMPEDFYSIDLMNAYESLGNLIGESVEEDLVNEIFDKFCMGK